VIVARIVAVCRLTTSIIVMAVVVTRTAHRTVSTVHKLGEVAPIPLKVKELVILANVVLPLTLLAEPVLSAVVGVREVAILAILAELSVTPAVGRDCGREGGWLGFRGDTVVVAFVADRTISAIYQVVPVTAAVSEVIELVIGAHVVSADAVRHALPVLPTVVRISEESISRSLAVHDSPAVFGGGSLCCRGAVAFIVAGTVTTVNIERVSTPIKNGVVAVVSFALLMLNTSPITLIVVGAGIWISLVLEVIVSSAGSAIREGVLTLSSCVSKQ